MRKRHILRFIASLATSGFTFLGLSMTVLSFIFVGHGDVRVFWVVAGITVMGVAFWLLQAYFEYKRKTGDPTWALQYQEMWDKSTGWRNMAAKALQRHQGHLAEIDTRKDLADIDEVLDILEDIGFYMESDHLTPETARHHFGYWIQGYWRVAHPYVEAWQKREPSRWSHIKPLYDAVTMIEGYEKKTQVVEPDDFLAWEAGVLPPDG